MEKRKNLWIEVPVNNASINFIWAPFSNGINFEKLKNSKNISSSISNNNIVNHFECHEEITRKDKLYRNLKTFCELNRINIHEYVPITFIVNKRENSFNFDLETFINFFNIINKKIENSKVNSNSPNHIKFISNINLCIEKYRTIDKKGRLNYCKMKMPESHLEGRNIWLLKPATFNRGRGVEVFDDINLLKKLISFYSSSKEDSNGNFNNSENKT